MLLVELNVAGRRISRQVGIRRPSVLRLNPLGLNPLNRQSRSARAA